MKTMRNVMRKVAGVCLCHRAMYGMAALAYGAGWMHLIDEPAVLATVGVVYLTMALRGGGSESG